jgi:hypothetical protein
VALLLLIALFTTVSGKLLDGLLMLAVATVLIFDGTGSRRQSAAGGRYQSHRAGRRIIARLPRDPSAGTPGRLLGPPDN